MTKRYIISSLLLLVFLFASGCAVVEDPEPSPSPAASVPTTSTPILHETVSPDPLQPPDPLDQAVLDLSTEEKVGQLLVVGLTGAALGDDARLAIEDMKVGGFILFGKNVTDADQLLSLTNSLKALNQRAGNVPLLLCVDEEGGTVSRMPPEMADLPNPYDYAQVGGDPYARGEILAAQCAAFGFHVDFAPVLDVWTDPDNTVIGKRAFSTDAQVVAQMGAQAVRGLMEGGVIPVGKHFPGHGDTAVDSHVGLPVVEKTTEELRETELLPFQAAIQEGLPAVMVGHILMTRLDPDLPASLSPAVVTDLLRGELDFDGVVFTDDLTMGAITNTYGVGEAAVLAIEAGCDVALVCHGWEAAREAHAALLEAVESGRISMSRLDDSVRRILALKLDETYRVDDAPLDPPDLAQLNAAVQAILPQ